MKRTKIKELLNAEAALDPVLVKGWVRTKRDAKSFSFIELNDGSCLANLQIVAAGELANYDEIRHLTTGAALSVQGRMIASQGAGQKWELQAQNLVLIGSSPDTYPLQKKRHTDEFLRTIAHIRPRTNKYGSAFRIRALLAHAVHQFFNDRGFFYIHTPILTASDCEGAGEMFRVTTLSPQIDNIEEDFFGVEANLTVSGQLEAEMMALALGDVYTFGPTFRAENSNTRRHAAEFWMVEPEMAFCDLKEDMAVAEDLVRHLVRTVMDQCPDDLNLFARFVDKQLMPRLEKLVGTCFERLPYTEAVKILETAAQDFEYPISYGADLQAEHERFLTETYFNGPVIVYDYPETLKPFYMRLNDDARTVAAMDVLVPGIGEIIGGSQREERHDILASRMDRMALSREKYWWYLESRRYGSVPHSGFGMGFERMVMLLTGIVNIRDVIPFPRTPKHIDF
ncbi:MAG: asparagine--tRNA ligase [Desulfatitalea sp.]|nr:asparagine--tRNA ligase [Desulfatitalea sp.]NNK02789.1 asparagine--tRNA ligase [Desulfatitalea sp.]